MNDSMLHFQDQEEEYSYTPTMEDLESWFNDSGCPCSGPCECWIEHDGICENGYQSQFLAMGLI